MLPRFPRLCARIRPANAPGANRAPPGAYNALINKMLRARTSLVLAGVFALTACLAAPAATPTPDPIALQTRVALELARIPTAAPLAGRTPLVNPTSPPASPAPPTPTTRPEAPSRRQTLTPAGEYVVKAGDTLSSIAVTFNTSMAAIQLLNGLDDVRVVRIGQVLKLPAGRLHPDESPWWFVHIVRPGETLSDIALKFRVQLDDLKRVNEIADPALVRAGQRLIVPARSPR